MKGFKVVREDMTHNGFIYKEGLNIDNRPFQTEGSCTPGGLYFFTDIKDVVKWWGYGVYLYEVEVPKHYPYVQDPEGDKYRAKALNLSNSLDLRKPETWEYLVKQGAITLDKEGQAFRMAATCGYLEVVKDLVTKGADIHACDDFALRWSAYKGNLDVVKYLVEQGANIHAANDDALCDAAEYGHLEIVKYLVEKGADIHARGDTALRWSVEKGHLDVVKYLVENGADVHALDAVAFRYAASNGYLEIIKYFVELGVNVYVELSLYYAEKNGHKDLTEYLRSL